MEVEGSHLLHFPAGINHQESQQADGVLQDDEGSRQQQAHGEGTQQDAGRFGFVALSVGLGGQPSGAHAQEAEYPVYHVEQHSAYGNGADVGSGA